MIKKFLRKLRVFFLDEYFKETHQHLDEIADELKNKLVENQSGIEQRLALIEAVARNGWLAAARGEDTLEAFQSNWLLESMSRHTDISEYKMSKQIGRLRKLLPLKKPRAEEGALFRSGHENDGGYIMLDKFVETEVAYSFGISDDVSWDRFMADQGFDVYMYDHTIESLPEENEKFHWHKIGLTGIYDEEHPELRTLPMMLEDNGHLAKHHMILKMDIEGAEWSAFANLPSKHMEQFDQIMLELHNLLQLEKMPEIEKTLTKLNETHQLVHIHGNNWEKYSVADGKVMPNVIECTYIKKDLCDFEDCESFLPAELDRANNEKWPDIILGKWN